jgi:hypothetical protein
LEVIAERPFGGADAIQSVGIESMITGETTAFVQDRFRMREHGVCAVFIGVLGGVGKSRGNTSYCKQFVAILTLPHEVPAEQQAFQDIQRGK